MNDLRKLSEYIYDIANNEYVMHKEDLKFALNYFIEEEEYEKCAFLRDLIERKGFDNTKTCWSSMYYEMSGASESVNNLFIALKAMKKMAVTIHDFHEKIKPI